MDFILWFFLILASVACIIEAIALGYVWANANKQGTFGAPPPRPAMPPKMPDVPEPDLSAERRRKTLRQLGRRKTHD